MYWCTSGLNRLVFLILKGDISLNCKNAHLECVTFFLEHIPNSLRVVEAQVITTFIIRLFVNYLILHRLLLLLVSLLLGWTCSIKFI